ncbi:MAG: NAD-dependent epimerase/dehydratase family protein [Planctomycetia bacterium]|nr:NAD-dependent epimerase/dehydratase family protein [Planctomycetia bacterium]
MKVLVTGGAGFIGSHVVDALLEAGHKAAVLDDLSSGTPANLPATVPLHVADIVDTAAVRRVFAAERPDAVCHQAAQMSVSRSVREPLFDAQVNCIGLINVLDAAVAHGCKRFAFASSGGVLYGDVTAPAPETTPADPVSPYGITKWLGERYLRFYAAEHGLTAVALRYSNVYGPRQNPHGEAGVVAIFCRRLLGGEAASINGDGRYLRDYVFGADVARANLLALVSDAAPLRPGTLTSLNIGTGVGTDVVTLEKALRDNVAELLARRGSAPHPPAPVYGPARPGDLRSSLVDATLAGTVLGWRPEVPLPAGIARTAAWFAERAATAS